MVLCGTKNGSSMASFKETFEAPLFLRVYTNTRCVCLPGDDMEYFINSKKASNVCSVLLEWKFVSVAITFLLRFSRGATN